MKKGLGIILIVVAVIATIASQPIHNTGWETYMFENASKGSQMMMLADTIKYGSIGIGAIGLALLVAGFVKKS